MGYSTKVASRWVLGFRVLVALECTTLLGRAETEELRGEARALAVEGRAAYGAAEYERALELFRQAYALLPVPTLSVYEARSLTQLGRILEARNVYFRTTQATLSWSDPEQFHRAVEEAKTELVELERRIPKVSVAFSGSAAKNPRLAVYLDGSPLREVARTEHGVVPGEHEVLARLPGREDISVRFTVAEWEHRRLEIPLGADTPAPTVVTVAVRRDSSDERVTDGQGGRRALTYAAFGVGAAGLGTGIVSGLLAGSRRSEALRSCPDHRCVEGSAGAETLDEFRSLRTVSTLGYVVGVTGFGAGFALILTGPAKPARAPAIRPWIGLRSAGLQGVFR